MTNARSITLSCLLLALCTLTLTSLGCGDNADTDVDTDNSGLVSDNGAFEAHLTPDPNPPVTGNNTFDMHLMDANGEAVSGATVTVEPWMPAHGHGSSEEPKVEEKMDGMYTITDVVFTMPGHWEVRIDVSHHATDDRLVSSYDVQ
jgi:hypothetical protein